MPPTHCSLVPHTRPHVPQFSRSLCRSKHAPLHDVSPIGHIVTHAPLSQTWFAPHVTPHAPQLFGSDCVDTHLLPQLVKPCAALHRQVPF